MKKYLTKNNILYFLGVLIIGAFIALIIRITYAYMAPTFEDAYSNLSVESDTVDEFKFEGGTESLSLEATNSTLPDGGGNAIKTTTSKAKLKMSTSREGTENNSVTYPYYVYINIPNNNFTYIKENTPEILFQVTVDGVEITNIDGLKYGTFNGVSGFDVTTIKGNYLIAQKSIASSSSTEFTEQNWEFKLIYLNQNYDQSANYGNAMNIEISMKKEENKLLIADYIKSLYKTDGENGLYLHDADLANGAGDNSYRYAGANPNNYVCFGSTTSPCPDDNLYRIIGVFSEDVIGADGNATGEKEERVKLIKAYEAGESVLGKAQDGEATKNVTYYKGKLTTSPGYFWSGSSEGQSNWTKSTLNTSTLNGTYLTNLGEYANKIETTRWHVGGISSETVKPSIAYQNEIGAPQDSKTANAKIGLMYMNEYGFAATPENWATNLSAYNSNTNRNNNWMFLGVIDWIMSPTYVSPDEMSLGEYSYAVWDDGKVYYSDILQGNAGVARPTFSLKASVTFNEGTGTETDPIRIN